MQLPKIGMGTFGSDRYFNIAIWISVVSGVLMIISLMFYTLGKKKYTEAVG